jgi:hypothetical protein
MASSAVVDACGGGGARLLHTSVAVGEQEGGEQAGGAPGRKTSSRGVTWHTRDAVWKAQLRNAETKRTQNIGAFKVC